MLSRVLPLFSIFLSKIKIEFLGGRIFAPFPLGFVTTLDFLIREVAVLLLDRTFSNI